MTDMKPFGELSDAEKGALLLAHLEGKRIEAGTYDYPCSMIWDARPKPSWIPQVIYRIAPEPLIPDSINWEHVAPEWKFMARDKDGEPHLFTNDPMSGASEWGDMVSCLRARHFASYRRGTVDWKDSLVVRPS